MPRRALLAADHLRRIVTSFLQVIISWLVTRRVEKQYLIILAIVLVLGSLTLFLHDERFIKWKPTLVFWIFSMICVASQFIGEKNIPRRMMEQMFDAPEIIWLRVNFSLAIFFILLGISNLYVAKNFPTETWAFFKVFGIMGINFVFMAGLIMYLYRYMIEQPENTKENESGD